MKKIYLAVPYSHNDEKIRLERFEKVNKMAGDLMKRGYIVFSPISHSHPIAVQNDLSLNFNFWEKFDKSFIEWCDEMFILTLDGWSSSKGVLAESQIAGMLNKPITYISENY